MKTTYIDRANTNQEVFRRANSYKNPLRQAGKNIRQFEEYINAQQSKLSGHTVRAGDNDPLRQCMLQPGSALPVQLHDRRVGRPREQIGFKSYEHLFTVNGYGTKRTFRENPSLYIGVMEPSIRKRSANVFRDR